MKKLKWAPTAPQPIFQKHSSSALSLIMMSKTKKRLQGPFCAFDAKFLGFRFHSCFSAHEAGTAKSVFYSIKILKFAGPVTLGVRTSWKSFWDRALSLLLRRVTVKFEIFRVFLVLCDDVGLGRARLLVLPHLVPE